MRAANGVPLPTRRDALRAAAGAAGAVALASACEAKHSEARFWINDQDFKRERDRVGYIDATGQVRVRPQWLEGKEYNEGLAAVRDESGWGFIDVNGEVRVRPAWLKAEDFSDGVAAVRDERGWTWIDASGKPLVEQRFECVHSFSGGLGFARLPEVSGRLRSGVFFDSKGKTAFEVERYYPINGFSSGRCLLEASDGNGSSVGFLDAQGRMAIGFDFLDAGDFLEGLARVRARTPDGSNAWGVIDVHGTFVVPPRFNRIEPYSEGLAAARLDGKFGFLDRRGCFAVPPKFAEVEPFHGGLAAASMQKKWDHSYGYIDRAGEWVIPPQYLGADPFHCERALVEGEHFIGYIDPSGDQVVTLKGFQKASAYRDGLAVVAQVSKEAELRPSKNWRMIRYDCSYLDLAGRTVYSWTEFEEESKR